VRYALEERNEIGGETVVQLSSELEQGFSRRTLLTRAGALGLGALMANSLVACGDEPGAAPTASGGVTTVKIIQPSDVTLVLWSVDYLSEDLGLYKEEGLAVKRVPLLGGPVALQGLLSGAGAGNISTPGEMLGAVAKRQPVKALMSHTNLTAATLVVSKAFASKLGVTADDALADRTAALGKQRNARFGITTPGSQTDGFTRMALKQAGLDPDKDARVVPLQNAANSMAALQNGRIDGFMALSPVTEQAIVKFGAVPLLAVTKGDIKDAYRLQGQTLMARAGDIEANPDLYGKLVRANVHALRVLLEEPERARDTLRKRRFAGVDADMWSLMWQNNLPSWKSPFVSRDALAAWITGGLVADHTDVGKFPLDDAIEPRFVDEAVKSLKWSAPAA
jgi:NitT/TauT family transport system substrate-binding protein